jgi:YfiH family protein
MASGLAGLLPRWPSPPQVRAFCSTRSGGVSTKPFDSLNLGDHVGDEPEAVAANRRVLAQAIGARPLFLSQVHGTRTVTLDDDTPDGSVADACVTRVPRLACTVMVADCLPVLFCDRAGTTVAAAHAGWRGLAGAEGTGVLEEALRHFLAVARIDRGEVAAQTLAWLGPCIGPDSFDVGAEVRAAFMANDAAAGRHFRPHAPGKWLADLPALTRQRLAALGVTEVHGNDGTPGWCTVADGSRFFSHRRDGRSGRFAACIWLV